MLKKNKDTGFTSLKSDLFGIIKMLCLFAGARRSNVLFYRVWHFFKQASRLTSHLKKNFFSLSFNRQSTILSAGSGQKVRQCASSWTRVVEVKLVRLMPAVAIVCFSFPTGRIIPACLEKSLCQERREKLFLFSLSLLLFLASNFDVPIIVDLLLLG